MIKPILLSILCLSLVGCQKKQIVEPIPVVVVDETPNIKAPRTDSITVKEIKWKVYNKEDLRALLKFADESNLDLLLYTVEDESFKDLNGNLEDILALIQQQKAVIVFYEDSYVKPK